MNQTSAVRASQTQMDWLTLTHASAESPIIAQWQRASRSRFGRWMFARAVCRKAPFFSAIAPQFEELRTGFCVVSFARSRAVENHVGTVHAMALGTLCELAAGMVTEVTIPQTMRWLPRGMTIEYLKPVESGARATARLDKTEWREAGNVGVPVTVVDTAGTEVVRAVITMYVSPRPARN